MRIAIFAPDPSSSDGIALHTRRLVEAWESAGHNVLWAYPTRGSYTAATTHSASGGVSDTPGARRVTTALTSFGPDIAVVQFAVPAVGLSIVALVALMRTLKRSGVPVVVCCHEASRELALLGPAARLIYAGLRHGASSFVAFSPVEAQKMVAAGIASRVTTLPHGIAAQTANPEAIERVTKTYGLRDPCVIAVGWLAHSKGTDLLLRAAPAVTSNVSDVQFVIAGTPRDRTGPFRIFGWADRRYAARLRMLATRLREQSVVFTGFIPEDDLDPLMRAATVIVLPYRSATQSGIAARVLATGTPVVASDLDALVAQLGDASLYFATGQHEDLAAVISEVLADPTLRVSLEAASACRVSEESYARVAAAIVEQGCSCGPGGVTRPSGSVSTH